MLINRSVIITFSNCSKGESMDHPRALLILSVLAFGALMFFATSAKADSFGTLSYGLGGTLNYSVSGVTNAGSANDPANGSFAESGASLITGTFFADGYIVGTSLNATSDAVAEIFDTAVFSGAAPGAMGQLIVTAPVSITGNSSFEVTSKITFGPFGIPTPYGAFCADFPTSNDCGNPANLAVSFPITNGVDTGFFVSLSGSAGAPGTYDPDASWSLVLPAGVTYTTASGYPIGGVVATTPEPTSLAMIIGGLLFLGLSWRTNNRRVINASCAGRG